MKRFAALAGLATSLMLILRWELTVTDAPPPLPTRPGVIESRAAATPGFTMEGLADIAGSITERPLFSPDRRPAARSEPVAAASADPVRKDNGLPRLTGVIVGPTGKWAIFAGADGKSQKTAQGDSIGGFTVRTIAPGLVTLSGSDGIRVLKPVHAPAADAAGAIPYQGQSQGAAR